MSAEKPESNWRRLAESLPSYNSVKLSAGLSLMLASVISNVAAQVERVQTEANETITEKYKQDARYQLMSDSKRVLITLPASGDYMRDALEIKVFMKEANFPDEGVSVVHNPQTHQWFLTFALTDPRVIAGLKVVASQKKQNRLTVKTSRN